MSAESAGCRITGLINSVPIAFDKKNCNPLPTNQDEVEARTTADATVGGGGGHSPRASAAGPARRSRPLHTAVAAAAA